MQSYHHRQQGVARFALQEDGDGIQPSLARLLLGVGAPAPPVLVLHAGVARVHLCVVWIFAPPISHCPLHPEREPTDCFEVGELGVSQLHNASLLLCYLVQ
eukprot:CAMPEP_0175117172 /NCGR_PEP_ID=MMETSP0086_2-20121207/18701_1 /TAXON_ID=136419 /ORGANISM="Unknown Unknown, Strain D1" /LENGTH=100 /DNA_ID=CAMNT_0016397777 /DNA_START=318 /DNA_END=620 /DNA_ORIENTATION=-